MKLLWHLVKYNFIFGKVKLAFLTVLSLGLYFLGLYFHSKPVDLGEFLVQYSLYIFFMIFTGKMNSKNNLMFDIKHLLAMPLTKKDIVFTKSIADIVHFLPMSFVFLYGVHLAKPEFHLFILIPIFFGLITALNMIALNKRVDFSRMQHSQASVKNSFLFLHKYLEMGIFIIGVLIGVGAIFGLLKEKQFLLEYALFLLICVAGFISYSQTLKMLKDETRSFFMMKRDTLRIGWKVVLVITPLFAFHKVYKDKDLMPNTAISKSMRKAFESELKLVKQIEDKQFLYAMSMGKEKKFFELLEDKKNIPWESELRGSYPTHLAAMSNFNILKELVKRKPLSINKEGKHLKRTPLFGAIRTCQVPQIDLLINQGASVNHQDKNGITPLMYALKVKCHSGIIMLRDKANLELVDNKKQGIDHYIKEDNKYYYLLYSKYKSPVRELASDKKLLKSE